MLADNLVLREVEALTALRGYPPNTGGVSALVEAFRECYATERDLRAAVNDILREQIFCPPPSAIYAVKRSRQADRERGCEQCDGTGYISVADAKGIGWSRRCECLRARIRAQTEAVHA